MLFSLFKKSKLEKLRAQGKDEEAKQYIYIKVREWGQFIIRQVGAEVEVAGEDNIPKGPCLFVSNHQGAMDIPLILGTSHRTIGFVAKKELLKYRFLAYWCKQINCVFMDRQNIREAMKSIDQGAEYLKNGSSLLIFPEGTRSKGPKVGEFKKGSIKLGLKAEKPIVPVSISGSYLLREANSGWKFKRGNVKITYGKPIDPTTIDKKEQRELTEKIREIIIENL
ncbi:MAG: 1-acyl-sn-glycerol-3-phosphate acyltransferase [Clostridiaceae bacterium]|nr:1-acyl-sn-glycerol-3-phosphate acyltransferase [Clostridiaceae bacterium]